MRTIPDRGAVSMRSRITWIIVTISLGVAAAVLPRLMSPAGGDSTDGPISIEPAVGMPGAPPTSAAGLRQRVSDMEKRLAKEPNDHAAAALLADVLLRQARVTGDGRLSGRAERLLTSVLKDAPGHYDALRLLSASQLSQHRFREALQVARRARDLRPEDAWNYGVIGDALIELGEYDEAFESFDKMMSLRPSAAAYARVAYARELQGNLPGALEAMELAREATTAHDPEAQAWYSAQVGELYLRMRKLEEAEREYRRAAFIFPEYPFAIIGLGKVASARGQRGEALNVYLEQLERTPTLELAGRIGDIYAEDGNLAESERYYQLGEDLAGPAIAQTEAALALFLAERNRKLPVAVKVAEAIAETRRDIFTEDALAWAYFKTGRLDDALSASTRALRTGTRDERILAHAAEIRAAK
ncbi:MAG TPA: tetratricopeptide repeat protein [Vicinamibacterales bacterium]|jgi:tetratricopeptide (TPR) repeat protein